MFRNQIKKIAIVDFDVHHGNGTEEIIRVLGKHKFSLNSENKFCDMQLTKTICSPWLDYDDPNNVLFISLHSYDENNPGAFYPSSGSTESSTGKSDPIYPGGILNVPICTETKFSYGYRNLFRTKVIPRLIRFEPDIIFVSAGFDGHENEHINIGSMKINEHDYRWITEELMKISRRFAQSRVISVLEGGYNIDAGVISSFAQSVMTHAKFLNICLNKQIENCTIMSKIKRKREYFKDLENFKKFRCEVSERTVEAYSRPLTRGTNLEIENLNKVEEVVNAPEIFTPSSLKGITKLTSVMDDPIKTPLSKIFIDY